MEHPEPDHLIANAAKGVAQAKALLSRILAMPISAIHNHVVGPESRAENGTREIIAEYL